MEKTWDINTHIFKVVWYFSSIKSSSSVLLHQTGYQYAASHRIGIDGREIPTSKYWYWCSKYLYHMGLVLLHFSILWWIPGNRSSKCNRNALVLPWEKTFFSFKIVCPLFSINFIWLSPLQKNSPASFCLWNIP